MSKLKTLGVVLLSAIGVLVLFVIIVGLGNLIQNGGYKLVGSIFMILFPIAVYLGVKLFNKKVNKLDESDYGFNFKKFCKNALIGMLIGVLFMAVVYAI